MSPPDNQRREAIRNALHAYVTTRRNAALERIEGTDAAAVAECKRQQDFFQLQPLLCISAECVGQIRIATHIAKAIHPDIKVKDTTNIKINPASMRDIPLVGTHVLGQDYSVDATGNGPSNRTIYEVNLLLSTVFDCVTVLSLLKKGDPDAIAAFGETPEQATAIAAELIEIDEDRCRHVSTHELAKQVFWPVESDPHDDENFHMLAPLFPTSLVHRVHEILKEDRFGEAAVAARAARNAGESHDRPDREYCHMVIQRLGGAYPRNVGHLNSLHRGANHLLASVPPVWRQIAIKPVLRVDSLFDEFCKRPEVRKLGSTLRRFLQSDPTPNQPTVLRRTELVDALLDELMLFTAEVRTLDPGWSSDPSCNLPGHQIVWLDRKGADEDVANMIDCLAGDFAHWLNAQLRDPLSMGDPEYLRWRKQARDLFKEVQRESSHEQ